MRVTIVSEEQRPNGTTAYVVNARKRYYLLVLHPAYDVQERLVGYTPVVLPAGFVPGSADAARDAGLQAIERITGVGGPRSTPRREVFPHPVLPPIVSVV